MAAMVQQRVAAHEAVAAEPEANPSPMWMPVRTDSALHIVDQGRSHHLAFPFNFAMSGAAPTELP